MTPTPVGMRCPECSKQRTKVKTLGPSGSAADARVTKVLIAVNVAAYLGELLTGPGGGLSGVGRGSLIDHGALLGHGGVDHGEYWRLLSGGFLHAGVLHIGFNMYLLWILGRMMEPALGSVRFGALYLVALLAGSFGALLVTPASSTVGASGAVFGLMGAAFIDMRMRGIDPFKSGIGGLIVINLVLSFAISGISIGGHIGGLIGGGLAAFAFQYADRLRRPVRRFAPVCAPGSRSRSPVPCCR